MKKLKNIKLFREYVETYTDLEQDLLTDKPEAGQELGQEIPEVENDNVVKEEQNGRVVYTLKDWKVY